MTANTCSLLYVIKIYLRIHLSHFNQFATNTQFLAITQIILFPHSFFYQFLFFCIIITTNINLFDCTIFDSSQMNGHHRCLSSHTFQCACDAALSTALYTDSSIQSFKTQMTVFFSFGFLLPFYFLRIAHLLNFFFF